LRGYGSTQSQLPDLNQALIDGLKIYPDEPNTQNISENDSIIAEKIQKFTYISTKATQYTFPPITINWWNIDKNQLETTELTGKTITITALNQEQEEEINKPESPAQHPESLPLITHPTPVKHQPAWLLAGLFLGLWLATLLLWGYQTHKNKRM